MLKDIINQIFIFGFFFGWSVPIKETEDITFTLTSFK